MPRPPSTTVSTPAGHSLEHVVHVPKISFQVAGVLERHPAGERKRKRVSDTWTFHHWKQQTKQQTPNLTLPLACFVFVQIGVISGSFRKASLWVKLVSGSKWGAARSAGNAHPVPERRDPAAPGSLHAAQHSPRDERGGLTLRYTGAPTDNVLMKSWPAVAGQLLVLKDLGPASSVLKESRVEPQLNAGWWDFISTVCHFGSSRLGSLADTWTGCHLDLYFITVCGNHFHHCTLHATANCPSLSVCRLSLRIFFLYRNLLLNWFPTVWVLFCVETPVIVAYSHRTSSTCWFLEVTQVLV